VERVPEDDIKDLEKLMMNHVMEGTEARREGRTGRTWASSWKTTPSVPSKTVVTKEWVVFDHDDGGIKQGHYSNYGNQFVGTRWLPRAETSCCFRLFQGDVAVSNQLA
jgi:hypothetical protein